MGELQAALGLPVPLLAKLKRTNFEAALILELGRAGRRLDQLRNHMLPASCQQGLQAMAQAHEQVRRAMEAFEAQLTQLRALGCQMQQCATLNRGTARQLQEALPGHTLVREKRMIAGIQQLLADCASAVAESKGRVKLPCLHEAAALVLRDAMTEQPWQSRQTPHGIKASGVFRGPHSSSTHTPSSNPSTTESPPGLTNRIAANPADSDPPNPSTRQHTPFADCQPASAMHESPQPSCGHSPMLKICGSGYAGPAMAHQLRMQNCCSPPPVLGFVSSRRTIGCAVMPSASGVTDVALRPDGAESLSAARSTPLTAFGSASNDVSGTGPVLAHTLHGTPNAQPITQLPTADPLLQQASPLNQLAHDTAPDLPAAANPLCSEFAFASADCKAGSPSEAASGEMRPGAQTTAGEVSSFQQEGSLRPFVLGAQTSQQEGPASSGDSPGARPAKRAKLAGEIDTANRTTYPHPWASYRSASLEQVLWKCHADPPAQTGIRPPVLRKRGFLSLVIMTPLALQPVAVRDASQDDDVDISPPTPAAVQPSQLSAEQRMGPDAEDSQMTAKGTGCVPETPRESPARHPGSPAIPPTGGFVPCPGLVAADAHMAAAMLAAILMSSQKGSAPVGGHVTSPSGRAPALVEDLGILHDNGARMGPTCAGTLPGRAPQSGITSAETAPGLCLESASIPPAATAACPTGLWEARADSVQHLSYRDLLAGGAVSCPFHGKLGEIVSEDHRGSSALHEAMPGVVSAVSDAKSHERHRLDPGSGSQSGCPGLCDRRMPGPVRSPSTYLLEAGQMAGHTTPGASHVSPSPLPTRQRPNRLGQRVGTSRMNGQGQSIEHAPCPQRAQDHPLPLSNQAPGLPELRCLQQHRPQVLDSQQSISALIQSQMPPSMHGCTSQTVPLAHSWDCNPDEPRHLADRPVMDPPHQPLASRRAAAVQGNVAATETYQLAHHAAADNHQAQDATAPRPGVLGVPSSGRQPISAPQEFSAEAQPSRQQPDQLALPELAPRSAAGPDMQPEWVPTQEGSITQSWGPSLDQAGREPWGLPFLHNQPWLGTSREAPNAQLHTQLSPAEVGPSLCSSPLPVLQQQMPAAMLHCSAALGEDAPIRGSRDGVADGCGLQGEQEDRAVSDVSLRLNLLMSSEEQSELLIACGQPQPPVAPASQPPQSGLPGCFTIPHSLRTDTISRMQRSADTSNELVEARPGTAACAASFPLEHATLARCCLDIFANASSRELCITGILFQLVEADEGSLHINNPCSMSLVPPFTEETARKKVQAAEDGWNSKDPQRVAKAYTEDCVWRNRDQFFQGREAIISFLTDKWAMELGYRLKKHLFCFTGNKIAVHFQYEFHDAAGQWWRAYGNEHWTFNAEGIMSQRDMSANNVGPIKEADRKIF
ncbi:hypothetical protein WJX84_001487 [Apatococcus fuscideae]|uniref:Uncharacterized protein n=1 Tax=Apatococcus fuscideae TaxID=2026836 RepID=A0AAW1T7J9_9CHLO